MFITMRMMISVAKSSRNGLVMAETKSRVVSSRDTMSSSRKESRRGFQRRAAMVTNRYAVYLFVGCDGVKRWGLV